MWSTWVTIEGIQTTHAKVQAVVDQPAPKNISELRSFLGQIYYCAKYIPTYHPPSLLLKAGCPWVWSEERSKAFQLAKVRVTQAQVLAHFDKKLPISLAADPSPYGVGAVISHTMPDRSERLITYASRTLSEAKKM